MPTSARTPDQRSDRDLGTSKWAPRLGEKRVDSHITDEMTGPFPARMGSRMSPDWGHPRAYREQMDIPDVVSGEFRVRDSAEGGRHVRGAGSDAGGVSVQEGPQPVDFGGRAQPVLGQDLEAHDVGVPAEQDEMAARLPVSLQDRPHPAGRTALHALCRRVTVRHEQQGPLVVAVVEVAPALRR